MNYELTKIWLILIFLKKLNNYDIMNLILGGIAVIVVMILIEINR